MTRAQKLFSSAATAVTAFAATPLSVLANTIDTININPSDNTFSKLNNIRPSGIVSMIINIFLGGAGVIAFIFLLWGGLQWILAGGDKEGTEKARKKITSSLIGLAIVFSAYALIYIIRALFGINLIQLNLTPIANAT